MLKTVLVVVFLVYGIPLWRLRYRWRATVYRMSSWKINVLPWFGKDVAALFTNRFFRDAEERRMAARFRLYLAGYFALLAAILALPSQGFTVPDTPVLLQTLGISILVQAVFFAFAASLKTDKVTDLSYGLTFIVIAASLLLGAARWQPPQVVLALMVVVWGGRLAGYLLYRIVRIGRDPRFDGIRERFWSFAKFWLFQGVAVWVIMLPVTLWFASPGGWGWPMSVGLGVWLIGLVIETVADVQKYREKSRPGGGGRWVDTGLWRYSRHPNYFGELLCWWGVFLFVAGDLSGWASLAALAGPVTITVLLLFVTGIPTLEHSAQRKWGGDPAFEDYRRRTRLLVPLPLVRPAGRQRARVTRP